MLTGEKIMLALNDCGDEYIIRAGRRLGYLDAARSGRGGARRAFTLALAAALVLGLGAAAYAVGAHSGFFKAAFGTGVPGQSAHSADVIAPDGGVLKTETFPEIERVDADDELAEALLGEYVSAVGQSVQIGNYTATVREAVVDANGLGALTVDITNPDGHGFAPDGSFSTPNPAVFLGFSPQLRDGTPIAARNYAAAEGYSDTEISFVYYIAPPVELDAGEDIVLRFTRVERDSGKRNAAEIIVPAAECVSARRMSADGASAELSPIGLTLSFSSAAHDAVFEEYVTGDIVITFADGETYTVKSNTINNAALGTYDHNNPAHHKYVLNRIIDPAQVKALTLRTTHYTSHGETEENYTLK